MKKKSKIIINITLTILFVVTLTFSQVQNQVFAQETPDTALTLTAIPPRIGEDRSLVLKPGEVVQQVIRLKNSSSQPVTISSVAKDFIIGEDGVTPIKIKETDGLNRWSLANWMVITPSVQTVQPNQTIGVSVLIKVPEDALPGGHYAMVTHQPNVGGADLEGKSASAISQEVGTLFYVEVEGPINEEAFIRNFSFPKITEYGPVPFSFTVDNVSDIHITPRASVEITNVFGKKINTIKLDPKNIFPFTNREFSGEWDAIWGTGFYTAKVTMAYGNDLKIVMAKTNFWLLPVKLIIVSCLLLLLIIIIILSVRSHIRHRSVLDSPKKIAELEKELNELKKNSK